KTAIAITRMIPTAPRIENSISRGGIVAISFIAFSATSRGWIFGFSSCFRGWNCTTGCNGSAGSGAGCAKTGSLSGGSSSRSEKLLPDEPASGSDIMGSTATRGNGCSVSCSSTAADNTGPLGAWNEGALTSGSPSNSSMSRAPDSGTEFASEKLLAEPPAPAAAAAALASAAGGSTENTGASTRGETGLGGAGGAEGAGLGTLDAAETNLLAAAARAAELTARPGAGFAFFDSVTAFLPFSLHLSKSSNSSRAL